MSVSIKLHKIIDLGVVIMSIAKRLIKIIKQAQCFRCVFTLVL